MWLAGLLEGEGAFGHLKGKGPYVKLTMSDKDVVDKASVLMQATSVIEMKPKQENWKMCYTASITGFRAERLMNNILPYMGKRRSAKIQEALALWENRGGRRKRENGAPPDCHPDRKQFARGLCKECYSNFYNEQRRKNRKEIKLLPPTSANCHPDKLLYARGLCKACYNKNLKEGTPIKHFYNIEGLDL